MQERPCGAMERRCTKRREPPSYMSYWSYMSYRVVFQAANQPGALRSTRVFVEKRPQANGSTAVSKS